MAYGTRKWSRQLLYLVGGITLFLLYYIYTARTESQDPIYRRAEDAFLSSQMKEGSVSRQQQDVNLQGGDRGDQRPSAEGERGQDERPLSRDDRPFEGTKLGRRMREAKERERLRKKKVADGDSKADSATDSDQEVEGTDSSPGTKPKLSHDVKEVPSSEPLAIKDESPSTPLETLKTLIKQHPILLFSKTYCPHSAKAKRILLENYQFTPEPFVVELDSRETNPPHDGRMLQEELRKMTGRATVPNLLVKGESLGGGSELEELSDKSELIKMIEEISLGTVRGTKPR